MRHQGVPIGGYIQLNQHLGHEVNIQASWMLISFCRWSTWCKSRMNWWDFFDWTLSARARAFAPFWNGRGELSKCGNYRPRNAAAPSKRSTFEFGTQQNSDYCADGKWQYQWIIKSANDLYAQYKRQTVPQVIFRRRLGHFVMHQRFIAAARNCRQRIR